MSRALRGAYYGFFIVILVALVGLAFLIGIANHNLPRIEVCKTTYAIDPSGDVILVVSTRTCVEQTIDYILPLTNPESGSKIKESTL